MSVSLSQWVTTASGASAINLGQAQLLSVVGSGPYSIQALVAGTEYTLDGPTYATSAAASAAITQMVNAVTVTALMPPGDPTVHTGQLHDV